MRTGDLHRGLITVPCAARNAVQRQPTGGDRLSMSIRECQPHEDRPPVVDEGCDASHDLAAFPVVCGEAGPTPLVFQLVEVVLRVPAIPVVLRDSAYPSRPLDGRVDHADDYAQQR